MSQPSGQPLDMNWLVEQERKIQAGVAHAREGRRLLRELFDAGHLYVIEFASGTLKVGKTRTPPRRLRSHAQAAAIYGAEVINSWVSGQHPYQSKTELELIKFCNLHGRLVSGREYFRDISFATAVDCARALVELELIKDADEDAPTTLNANQIAAYDAYMAGAA